MFIIVIMIIMLLLVIILILILVLVVVVVVVVIMIIILLILIIRMITSIHNKHTHMNTNDYTSCNNNTKLFDSNSEFRFSSFAVWPYSHELYEECIRLARD